MKKEWTRRRLPHWHPDNATFFVTFRLYASLPKEILDLLREEFEAKKDSILSRDLSSNERLLEFNELNNYQFSRFEEYLDQAEQGPVFLARHSIANIVRSAIHYFDNVRYEVIGYVIMSNHVHLLLHKLDRELSMIMQSIKNYASRQANAVLDRTGSAFWQAESYDRVVRDDAELSKFLRYTMLNPVKIGLVKTWRDFAHVYVRSDFQGYVPELWFEGED